MHRKFWHVRLLSRISREEADGSVVQLPAGEYTLREIDAVRYELMSRLGEAVHLRFAEVLRLRDSGQLHIEGNWP